jgi:hypothetical protein
LARALQQADGRHGGRLGRRDVEVIVATSSDPVSCLGRKRHTAMKLLVLPLLLAFAPLYDATASTQLGGVWNVRHTSNTAPMEFSTDPKNPICLVEMTPFDTLQVSHAIYKARVLTNTKWTHVTYYGDTVIAKSMDSNHVQVMAADSDPIDVDHLACVLNLTESAGVTEAQDLETAILDAGET